MSKKESSGYPLIILGIAVLTLLVVWVGWEEVRQVIIRIHPATFLLLVLLQLITLFLTGYMWYFLIKKCCGDASLGAVLGVHLAGKFVEYVTPSVKLGGETAKVYLMRRKTSLPYQQLTAISVTSKFFSLLPFALISLVVVVYAFLAWDFPGYLYLAFAGLLFMLLLFGAFLKMDKISHFFRSRAGKEEGRKKSSDSAFPRSWPVLLAMTLKNGAGKAAGFLQESSQYSRGLTGLSDRWFLFFLGFLVWFLYPVKVYLITDMLGFTPGLIVIVVATFTAYIVSMIPVLPGGLGTFEGTMTLVFTYAGLSAAEGLTIALVTQLVSFWIPLFISAGVSMLAVYRREIF